MEKALKGMLDGSVNPDSVVIEGLETEEQKRQKEVSTYFDTSYSIGIISNTYRFCYG